MIKYHLLVFFREYDQFLHEIRKLSVVHVVRKTDAIPDSITEKQAAIAACEKAIMLLAKRNPKAEVLHEKGIAIDNPQKILDLHSELDKLLVGLEENSNAIQKAIPWGDFDPKLIEKLAAENIKIDYYKSSRKKFDEWKSSGLPVFLVSEQNKRILFGLIQLSNKEVQPDAEPAFLPKIPLSELRKQQCEISEKTKELQCTLDKTVPDSIRLLQQKRAELIDELRFEKVILNSVKTAGDKLMMLEGWVPKPRSERFNMYLKENEVLFLSGKAEPGDDVPVLLRNNRFSRLFEPIGSMFSLPDYTELDLTLFFAPFFMLFFGFCLGDAGYGLLFVIGGGIAKIKLDRKYRPYLSLVQYLGLATILFGIVSGTLFGVNLMEAEIALTKNLKDLFLDPNKMFQLSLVLGALQIVFGLFLKAVNRSRQYGFQFALSTFGWLVVIFGSLIYLGLTKVGLIAARSYILYLVFGAGAFFILFFSDPKSNVLSRIGQGVWDVYSTVTGIFGDLLSYIRLFALGLSSAILGFVINDIGLQILESSKILGPVFFVLFLILGHTLNILISSLGSFVHPLRLTFVEFYKNAGFKGGGEAYHPFD